MIECLGQRLKLSDIVLRQVARSSVTDSCEVLGKSCEGREPPSQAKKLQHEHNHDSTCKPPYELLPECGGFRHRLFCHLEYDEGIVRIEHRCLPSNGHFLTNQCPDSVADRPACRNTKGRRRLTGRCYPILAE